MPCWYYDKKALRNTPSYKDGIDFDTEARYRREGARFILDCGSKMGLRFDTCASGVIYYHRFYMFHSFRHFPRNVMASCCLFLAGKVEETPKKCKDIIKTARSMLTDQHFMVFGEDPKEEVMTMERILLQTIKFDLQVQHPYQYLLKYAKHLKGDKAKIQNMIQMAWTFVNDSLCTSLGIMWEPEVISVALLYLASRLSKVDITDWVGKSPGTKAKWWDQFIGDVSMELLEEICHEVLDLYASQNAAKKHEESPPPPPPSLKPREPPAKKSRPSTPAESPSKSRKVTPETNESRHPQEQRDPGNHVNPVAAISTPQGASAQPRAPPPVAPPAGPAHYGNGYRGDDYTQFNPYVSQGMYTSSFMSQEGSQNIRSLMGGGGAGAGAPASAAAAAAAPRRDNYNQGGAYQQQQGGGYPQNPSAQYPAGVQQSYPQAQYPQQGGYQQPGGAAAGSYNQNQPQYNPGQQAQQPYGQSSYGGYNQQAPPPQPPGVQPQNYQQQQYGQNTQQQYSQYQNATYNQGYNPAAPPTSQPQGPPPGAPPRQGPPPPGTNGPPGQYNEHFQQNHQQGGNYNYNHSQGGYDYNASRAQHNPPTSQGSHQGNNLAQVRITGRR